MLALFHTSKTPPPATAQEAGFTADELTESDLPAVRSPDIETDDSAPASAEQQDSDSEPDAGGEEATAVAGEAATDPDDAGGETDGKVSKGRGNRRGRRIKELTEANATLAAELAEFKAKEAARLEAEEKAAAEAPRPDPADYSTDDEYQSAVEAYFERAAETRRAKTRGCSAIRRAPPW